MEEILLKIIGTLIVGIILFEYKRLRNPKEGTTKD